MTNNTKTRRSLFASILSMVLCLSMLLGTTLAWFTDTAVNTNNRVKAGTLEVQLLKFDGTEYVDISGGRGDIFNDGTIEGNGNVAEATLWEPNKTEVVLLKVENKGKLALDYGIYLDVTSSEADVQLEKVLNYAIVSGINAEELYNAGFTTQDAILEESGLTSWDDILGKDQVKSDTLSAGLTKAMPTDSLLAGESDYFALAVHMDTQAGNEYQNLTIDIDVNIEAQQKPHESDSFGNTYDTAVGSQNLLKNGGFEELKAGEYTKDNYPWTLMTYSGGVGSVGVIDTTEGGENTVPAHEGDKYAYTTITSKADTVIALCQVQWVALVPGAEYTLTAWVYRATESGYPEMVVSYPGNTEASVHNKYVQFKDVPVGEWTQVTLTDTVPQGVCQMRAYCRMFADENTSTSDPSTIYWDDVQLLVNSQDDEAAKWYAKLAAEDAVSQNVTVAGWSEPLNPGENLIKNADFSDGLNGWIPFDGRPMFNGVASLVDGYKGGDDKALRLVRTQEFVKDNPTTKSLYWQTEVNVTEDDWGDEYQLSCYYRMNENAYSAVQMSVSVYFWTDEHEQGSSAGWIGQDDIGPESFRIADGEWHLQYGTFIIPDGTKIVEIIPRVDRAELEANGAYGDFDELTLYKTCENGSAWLPYGSNGTFSLDTDGTIFYTDMKETTLSISMSDAAKSDAKYTGAKVKFEVYDGADVIYSPNEVAFTDGVAKVDFDLSMMEKINAPYCVKATIYDNSGNELWMVTKELFIFERPECLDENGKYVKFGEDFYPMIAYHANTNEDISKAAKEAGLNVIQGWNSVTTAEAVLKELDNCAALGVKGIVCLYNDMIPASAETNLHSTISIVSDPRVQNHEALFGYLTMDEPFYITGEGVREELIKSYRLIRQYDQKNLILHTENLEDRFHESAELADVILPDVYSKAEGGVVYKQISDAYRASTVAGEQKSLLSLLMCFDYYKRLGYWVYEDDVRNNNWQALIAGADMIGFFGISDGGSLEVVPKPKEEIPVWEMTYGDDKTAGARIWGAMCDFNNVEKEIAYDHFARNEGTKLSEDINIDNSGYITYSWADEDGQVYVVLLNVKGADNTVSVALKNADGSAMSNYTATVIAGRDTATETVNYTGTDGKLSVNMIGVEALLFTVTAN